MKTMEPKAADPRKKKVAIGAAGASVIFHITLFLLIGGIVVVEYAVPRSAMTGEVTPAISEETPAPDETPEPVGEPEATETPTEAAASAPAPISPDLTVSSINVLTVSSPVTSFQMPVATGGIGGTGSGTSAGTGTGGKAGKPGKVSNPFGGGERVGKSSLEGIFYDLKQTKDKKPTGMTPAKYNELLQDFFKRNWDRKILENFYRVSNPLYSTQIFIPFMSAGEAPKAFKVENEVEPSEWVVFYQGEFQAPKTGQYRLAGYADDILVVRVNGKVLLDGSIETMRANNKPMGDRTLVKVNGQEFVEGHRIGNGSLAYSDWQTWDASAVNKLEILVGERPGGQFCAFLFVEEKGQSYSQENGRPILPIFKTADLETAPSSGASFDSGGPIFGVK